MIFQKFALTAKKFCFNFSNEVYSRTDVLMCNNIAWFWQLNKILKLKLSSAPLFQPIRFQRTSVTLLPTGSPRKYILLINSIQNLKTLSSDYPYGLIQSALKQGLLSYAHALRKWFMQDQNADPQTTTIRWVTVEKCAELIGWTKDAINALRVKGKIRMDVHWVKRNGRIFIDMAALQQWIGTGK